FRDDITPIGVPLTGICNTHYSDPRQRQLFKNIMYVGALSALLEIDTAVIEALIGEQYRSKPKLLAPNIEALHLGRDWVRAHLPHPIGLRVQAADAVGDRIFVDGNDAAALGCVYGGATVCAWYPITPSSSLAEGFQKYCQKHRVDGEGMARYAVIQAEDEIASIGRVVGAGGVPGGRPAPRRRQRCRGPGLRLRRRHGLRLVPDHAVVVAGRGLPEVLPEASRRRRGHGALRGDPGRGRDRLDRHGGWRRLE